MRTVRRLADVAEFLELTDGDAFVRAWLDLDRIHSTWAGPGDTYGWVAPPRQESKRLRLTAGGRPDEAAALAVALREHLGPELGYVTLPRDADRHLPPWHRLRPRNDWDWFVTWDRPPVQPREAEVRWLDDASDEELTSFLQRWSPRHDARPGRPGVLRWCGVRGEDRALLAVGAHTEHVRGVPHLASIATAGDLRGQGYGAAVTAWLTRSLLDHDAGWVTLGMYSDNDVARRIYHRLGYRCDHYLTSGGLLVG